MLDRLLVVDSVTRLGPEAQGRVIVGGSHCGTYAAYLCAKARVAGVVLNDAGVGLEGAGVAGLDDLARLGVPAAAVSHRSARIGEGWDQMGRGVVSRVNAPAAALGVEPGMRARDAAERLLAAPPVAAGGRAPEAAESRFPLGPPRAVALDSASLLRPEDAGCIAVLGSHGGLVGGRPETAARVPVFAALYNDADGGIEGAGYTRLPALDARGIAAGTVSAWTARIGDGRSCAATGIVSALNTTALRLGARIGAPASEFVAVMAEAVSKGSKA
jgi:hypothetical protein